MSCFTSSYYYPIIEHKTLGTNPVHSYIGWGVEISFLVTKTSVITKSFGNLGTGLHQAPKAIFKKKSFLSSGNQTQIF